MQVNDFRKRLQDAIIALEKIAREIDEDALKVEEQARVDAIRNEGVAQGRLEASTGVTHVATADEKAAIEVKQRDARLAAQAKANEK